MHSCNNIQWYELTMYLCRSLPGYISHRRFLHQTFVPYLAYCPSTSAACKMATESSTSASNLSARRSKPAKPIPRLPLSAFSPPNSGTGEKFPLPPSPKTVHPQTVLDASVALSSADTLSSYSSALGNNLSSRLYGVVVSVPQEQLQSVGQMYVIYFDRMALD